METLDFLRLVLPSAGHGLYCAVSGKSKAHAFFENIEDLIPQFDKIVEAESDAYFALATYDPVVLTLEKNRRTQENARYLRALRVDLDGYPTPRDAWRAVVAFLAETGLKELGKPYGVMSGGGLHVYWPLTEDVERDEWVPVANNLKRLLKQEKLKTDTTVTSDAARILRPPGTYNFKQNKDGTWKYGEPMPVQIVVHGNTFDFRTLANAIADLIVPGDTAPQESAKVIPLNLPGQRVAAAANSVVQMQFKNQTSLFKNIVVRTEAGDGCGQLAYYKEHASDDGMEPLWRGLLSIANKCDDGWDYAVELTAMHPYPMEKLTDRWHRLTGPQYCKTFHDLNPETCEACPHWGTKIRTPIQLGRETLKASSEPVEVSVKVAPISPIENGTVTFTRPEPPYGFFFGQNGGVMTTIAGSKKIPDRDVMLLRYDLYAVGVFSTRANEKHIRFVAHHPKGLLDFNVPMKVTASKDETIKLLAEKGIGTDSPDNALLLHKYIMGCAAMASEAYDSRFMASQYGWQEDKSFVYGGYRFARGCKPERVPMDDKLANVMQAIHSSGTLEATRRAINWMISRKMYRQLAVAMLAAGAPFMQFTGLHGLVIHCASKESGTGKSVTLDLASSFWGEPLKYKVNPKTSANAMFGRVGALNSLPLTSDELTTLARQDFAQWFPDFLLSFTDGRGKERLKQTGEEERVNTTSWSSIALLSSNSQCVDLLFTVRHAVEGEVRRIMEFHMDTPLNPTQQETAIIESIQHNYGIVGLHMSEYLAEHNDGHWEQEMAERKAEVVRWLDASGAERYWVAGVACGMQAIKVFNELGIARIPADAIFAEYERVVKLQRKKLGENRSSALDVLNTYIEDHSGNFIVRDQTSEAVNVSSMFGVTAAKVNQIFGRIEHKKNGTTEVVISKSRFTKHCADMSFSNEKFLEDIANTTGFMVNESIRSLSHDVSIKTGKQRVLVVTMTREAFSELQPNSNAVGEG